MAEKTDRRVWLLISFFAVVVAVQYAGLFEWGAAVSVPADVGLWLILFVWALRATDGTARLKVRIFIVFTVFAYLIQAPLYADHPYQEVSQWIGQFTFKMIFVSGLLWSFLNDWRGTLGLALVVAVLALFGVSVFAILFLLPEAVEFPYRAAVVISLVVIIALLHRISENLKRKT